MLCLKKVYTEDLLQLAILLSLLRTQRNIDLSYHVPVIGVGVNDVERWDMSRSLGLRTDIHPKSMDNVLLDFEQQVFRDLNCLGRYGRLSDSYRNVTAYIGLTNNPHDSPVASTSADTTSSSPFSFEDSQDQLYDENFLYIKEEPDDSELTQEDMDLIEVLWKQDVDMGFSLEQFQEAATVLGAATAEAEAAQQEVPSEEKLKYFKVPDREYPNTPPSLVPELKKDELLEEDPWAGLSYTVDLETGEYILKEECDSVSELCEDEPPSALLDQTDFSLEEALQLVGLNEDTFELPESAAVPDRELPVVVEGACKGHLECGPLTEEATVPSIADSPVNETSLEEDLDLLAEMIQTPNYHHHPHPRSFQGRMPYTRSMSMEQRWQDLASLLSLPPPPLGAASSDYGHHHHHHHHHQHYLPSYHHPEKILHNATLSPPGPAPPPSVPPDPYSPISSHQLGSAVASSMNLMTNGSEPMGGEAAGSTFKMENPHDMMYYQNGTGEIGHNNADGFLSSILNDEDLQLMDMAMNEGMYTMRMLEGAGGGGGSGGGSGNAGGGGTDSDSAVSSMGSERVPSLTSDTDWMETNSDSGHTPADHFMTDYHGKCRWYNDYGYGRQHSTSNEGTSSNGYRMPPVAQKKHHMYGKRFFHEQTGGNNSPLLPHSSPPCNGTNPAPLKFEFNNPSPTMGANSPSVATNAYGVPLDMVKGHHLEMKYSCSVEFSRQNLVVGPRSSPGEAAVHNHTYHMPPEQSGVQQRPLTRDKKVRSKEEEHHLTRDERRARSLSIPISVEDIINLPMDEFNERLSKYDLSENQLSLIRDIRRRGKNKVAAQNCRKRKLDQILSLADEVKQMREKKQRLLQERELLLTERHRVKSKFTQLYRHIFQSLRDPEGNPYSPYEWSLQQSADGTVVLVPRGNQTALDQPPDHRPSDDRRNP